MDHSASYKIILLGEVGVGKTSLFNRIRTGKFCDTQSSTGGLDCCYQYSTTIDNDRIMVSLWDTAGLERFRSGSPLYSHYRRATGALLVYSVEDSYTFENLQDWITEATHCAYPPELFKWALIGNKCDLPNEIESTRVEARREQLQTRLSYSVSAKTGHNVMKAFNDLIAAIHQDKKQEYSTIVESSIQLSNIPAAVHKSQPCCR